MGTKVKLISDFFSDTVTNETKVSNACDISSAFGFSVQVAYTGATLAGTVKLEASLDEVNWEEISGTSTAVVASGSTILFNQVDTMFPFTRLSIESTNANTITATAKIFTKGM